MALIGINITITGYAGQLIIVWKKNSNIAAEVGRSSPGELPFPVDEIYTIPDLQPVVYLVEFWRSDDGTTLNEFIKSWEIDASRGAIFSETTYEYVVGRGDDGSDLDEVWADPADGDLALYDERLALSTHENTKIFSRGHGQYRRDEITFNGTGFEPTGGVSIFSEGDTFFATVLNKTDLQPDANSSAPYGDVKELKDDVDNSIDFDSSFYSKLCYTNFSGTVGTIVFPALSLIPDCRVKFITHGGSQNYLKLQFNSGDTAEYLGEDKNVIYLNKGGMIELIFKDNVCYIADHKTNELQRGDVYASFVDKSYTGAYLLANESVGVLDRDDYPALYELVLEKFEVGAAVTLAAWATDKTRWAIDIPSHTFQVPHLDDMYRRFRTGSEATGTKQDAAPGTHTHPASHTDGTVSFVKRKAGGPGGGLGLNAAGSGWELAEANTGNNPGATETRVKSYKEIPLIVL